MLPSPLLPPGAPYWLSRAGRKPVIEDNIEGKRGQGRQGRGEALVRTILSLCYLK